MKGLLTQIFRRRAPIRAPDGEMASPPLEPDQPFVAIGDVHGRVDLLLDIDRLIAARCPGWPVVLLGDYIDRGEHSREVLELLMSVSPGGKPPVTCLMGNHERMLLDFLDDPAQNARQWLKSGGLQVLANFAIVPPRGGSTDMAALGDLRDRLAEAMGASMIEWLRARPLTWCSGNVWAVHAAADPDLPMSEQSVNTLLWGHPEFHQRSRADGQWVVHGHTVVAAPQAQAGRIAVDTGAYATGRLSAAIITAEGFDFLQTGDG